MKKVIALVTGLVIASSGFAADAKSAYYTNRNPSAKALQAGAQYHPPTDITIINSSSNVFYAAVPNTPIYDRVDPSGPYAHDQIRNDSWYGDTFISLQDPNHVQFFGQPVCRLAIINVKGVPNNYSVEVNTELCR